jgi:Phage integrase family
MLELPDTGDPLGLRDRAMMEVTYSSGLRRAELVSLRIGDLVLGDTSIIVRNGKGGKERIVSGVRCFIVWGQVLHCNIFPENVPTERSTSVGAVRSLSHFQIGGWGGWRRG